MSGDTVKIGLGGSRWAGDRTGVPGMSLVLVKWIRDTLHGCNLLGNGFGELLLKVFVSFYTLQEHSLNCKVPI